MNKKVWIPICCAIAFLGLIYVGDKYFFFKPFLMFQRCVVGDEEDYFYEGILMFMGYGETLPLSKQYREAEISFIHWSNDIIDSFYYKEYLPPTNVKVYAKLINHKITFTFKGYATTQEGETIDYFEEASFDFGIIPELKHFDKPRDD